MRTRLFACNRPATPGSPSTRPARAAGPQPEVTATPPACCSHPGDSEPAVEVRNLSFSFRGSERNALNDVSLEIASGDFVVLSGPSGCGKSTLALALSGFLFAQYDGVARGAVYVAGCDVRHSPIYDVAELVGLVQQNPESQFCTLTVEDEVAFGLENRCLPRAEIRARLDWALEVVGARHLAGRTLATLSGGEKQRIAIAAVMAARPRILIFDEPTSNLDPTATAQIFDVIDDIRALDGITVIVIEHKTAYLARFAPRWLHMADGRLSEHAGTPVSPLSLPAGPPTEPVCLPASTSLPGHAAGETLPLRPSVPACLPTEPVCLPAPTPAEGVNRPTQPAPPDSGLTTSDLGLRPLLRIRHLSAAYPPAPPVLHDISLDVGPGELVAVMGDNGSGKTTFLQCVLGLVKPLEGAVTVLGHDTRTMAVSKLARDVAYVFQNPDHQLFAESVWDEASLAPRNFGTWTAEGEARTAALLEAAGLATRRDDHPYRLSYGQKRRLNLVAVLSYAPRLILLDEILIGQDPDNAQLLLGWVQACVLRGSSALFVNHAPAITRQLATRLLFFEQGQLAIDAPTVEAFAQLAARGRTAYLAPAHGGPA